MFDSLIYRTLRGGIPIFLLVGGIVKRIITTGKAYNELTEVLTGLGETDQVLPIPR